MFLKIDKYSVSKSLVFKTVGKYKQQCHNIYLRVLIKQNGKVIHYVDYKCQGSDSI